MKNTSKALIEMMKREATEDRPSIDELIQQMDYKLNKRLALLENTIRLQILTLSCSPVFLPKHLMFHFTLAVVETVKERENIMRMPASPIFRKGGTHHKFTVEQIDGEEVILVKHPKRDKSIFPDPPRFNLN